MINNEIKTLHNHLAYSAVSEQKLISLKKFIILNIFSFGFYLIAWIFQAWRFFLQKDHLDIRIALRTGFGVIYLYPLFLKIKNYASKENKVFDLKSLIMYLGVIITCILPEPLSYISILSFIFFIPAFRQLNHAKRNDPDIVCIEQNKFSWGHKIVIFIGTIFWVLILFSVLWTIMQASS